MMRSIHRRGEWAWLVVVGLTSVLLAGAVAAQEEPADVPAGDVAAEVLEDDPGLDEDPLFEDDPGPNDEGLEDEFTDDELVEGSSAPDPHAGLETITVTAQKREQKLQDVPAAVSAITGEQLEEAGINQMQDIALQVPNLHWGQELGNARITIRGVSNAAGTDQATAFHIDGVYRNRAKSITSLTFFDVRRIEVLRGPQGTLYGRNATGGAINVVSNPPSPDFEVLSDVQFGTYYQKLIRGVINVPLAEDVAAIRVAGYWEQHDGYQKNLTIPGPSDDYDDADDIGIRTQLLVSPTDDLDVTLRFNYFRKKGVGYALKREGPLPEFVDLVPGGGSPIPIPPQPIYYGATENPENPRQVYLDWQGGIDNEMLGGNADISWRVPEIALFGETKLKVLGSFDHFDDFSTSDQDYSDNFIANLVNPEENREWVAEINWTSDNDGRFGWLLGAFHLGAQGANHIVAPALLPIVLDPSGGPPYVPDIVADLTVRQNFDSSVYSVAGFTNAWFDITDAIRAEAGFRYSYDWKTSDALHPESNFVLGPITVPLFELVDDSRSDSWGRPSGSLSVDWRVTDDHMVYGRFATGYKSGALNNDIAILGGGIFSPPDASPEDIFSLEFGSRNTLLDNKLIANGTFFAYWYRDLQVSQLLQAQNFIDNAAKARSVGIELEAIYRPIDPLTLTAQFAFLDSEYTEYTNCVDTKDPLFPVTDCTGNRLNRAPRFSGTFIAQYDIDLGKVGTVSPFAQVYASDDVFFRPTNDPEDTQGAYAILNFRLMYRTDDGRFGVDLFIDNALDEDIATTKLVGSSLLGTPQLSAYDRPRTAGFRITLAY